MVVRNQALAITRSLRPKDFRSEACACLAWVKANVRYVRDMRSAEVLHDPLTLLGYPGHAVGDFTRSTVAMAGDCDDMALLLSALLESIGHTTRFIAVSYRAEEFAHVWLQDFIDGTWLDLEPTEPLACGSRVPRGVAEIVQGVTA
jgi:transglutaminase-like putative cysteine protease